MGLTALTAAGIEEASTGAILGTAAKAAGAALGVTAGGIGAAGAGAYVLSRAESGGGEGIGDAEHQAIQQSEADARRYMAELDARYNTGQLTPQEERVRNAMHSQYGPSQP
jgi:hypothetical protein